MDIHEIGKRENIFGPIEYLISQKNRKIRYNFFWIWQDGATGEPDGWKQEYTHFTVYIQGQGETLDIKAHTGWKYDDKTCILCNA